jgi:hypothetical protein
MNVQDIIQLIINNGLAVGVAVYFLMKDWKQSSERIDADKKLSESIGIQAEVLRQLNDTVQALKDIINKKVD